MSSLIEYLRSYQKPGERYWELPTWNDPLAQAVFPLCIVKDDHIFPVGTAFIISHLGIIASASHNIFEAIKLHRHGDKLLRLRKVSKQYKLDDVSLSILHQRQNKNGSTQITIWPLNNVNIAHPTDVVFGSLVHQILFAYPTLSLSPSIPKGGASILSLGYSEFKYPASGIPLQSIRDGSFNWTTDYSHRFRMCEGKIDAIFTQKFAAGFNDGPCFIADCEIEHGQSGGPVFNEQGFVCGVNSAGLTELLETPGCLISMLFPTLPISIKSTVKLCDEVTINAINPLITLIQRGAVKTDGSEKFVIIKPDNGDFYVDPIAHKDNVGYIFENVHGYLAKHPALGTPLIELLKLDNNK